MNTIPKQFHFLFGLKAQTEPFHLAWYLCLRSCLAVNPDYQITLYYLNEPYGPWWDRIRRDIELVPLLDLLPSFDQSRYADHNEGRFIQKANLEYAHQSDILRLQILVREGGIYADIDSLFVRPYPAGYLEQRCLMGQESANADPPTLCNAIIMAAPNSQFIQTWLDGIEDAFDGTWNRHSCIEPAQLSARMPDEITIVGPESFFHFRYDREGLTDLLGRVADVPDELCSIHLWNHLWWEPWRNDFIRFNNTHLTERFVREVDTTYNLLARHYLD